MPSQPTGTITMLFSDVEGSTELLGRIGADRYADVLEQHNRLLRKAFVQHGGYEVDTAGDSFFVSFSRAADAASAAEDAQRSLAAATWPDGAVVRVRMAIHTGEPLLVGANYVGIDVHRAARVMAAAHGGQVLVSETTASLLDGVVLRDLGSHRLKDLLAPIRLHQLLLDGLPDAFPPPRSLYRTNLPTAAWPLLGRERELGEIRRLIADGVRLVTLTGPGGTGKTRLALQAAAESSEAFADGVFFVALASLRDVGAVGGAVAEAVGLKADDDLCAWLRSRRLLLVLDNLEHLRGVGSVVADLLIGETVVIATSRASLRLSAERELQVEPLPEDAAVELFVSRAAAVGRTVAPDEVTAAVCRRLDNLPLAVELAAARSKLLSPSALLDRLEVALPLLTGGVSDLPERQRTLRATIEWSHDLLDGDLRTAFRRLSIFRGSFTLDAAEAITGASIDQLEALLDQSLLKPLGGERFFQLETIREYAREQLAAAGETDELALEHAHHYLRQLREYESHVLGSQRGALLSWFEEEEENLRAAMDRLEELSPAEAAEAASLLMAYWLPRNQLVEARRRVERILASVDLSDSLQGYLLSTLADCAFRSGDHEVALATATEALVLAERAGDRETIGATLYTISMLAIDRGDFDEAWDTLTQALEQGGDDPSAEALLHAGRASVAVFADRDEEAREEFQAARACFRDAGDEANDVSCAIELAEFEVFVGDCDVAAEIVVPALEWSRMVGDRYRQGGAALILGFAEIGRGRPVEARVAFREALELVLASERTNSVMFAAVLSGIAYAVDPRLAREAARLLGAAARVNGEAGLVAAPRQRELKARAIEPFIQSLGADEWTREHAVGGTHPLEETIALALSLVDSSL